MRRVGSAVKGVAPGDPVLLSFSYCGTCHVCRTGPPSHCKTFFEINFMGEPVFSDNTGGKEGGEGQQQGNPTIGGRFFGQSSFAKHTVVSDKCVVNVAGLGLERDDLKLLAPLGCGLQTGSGTIVNVAKCGKDDEVVVVGMGGVGLAAVMVSSGPLIVYLPRTRLYFMLTRKCVQAAKNQGCKTIIGIDRVQSRLDLAKALGATHVINTSTLTSNADLVAAVLAASSDGHGATVSIDTSAHPPLVAAQIDFTRYMGKVIQVGTGMPDAHLSIHMQSFMVSGKQYFGAVQGHSRPAEYIPQMIKWWREGVFPVEKLVQFFDIADFESAVNVMGSGSVVKPIIVW